MKVAFFGNSLNNHQVHFSDEMYKLLGKDYTFVVCVSIKKANLKGGKDYHDRPYCLAASENEVNKEKACSLAVSCDVAIFGANSMEYEVLRMSQANPCLSFEVGERWFKRGWINVFSPRLLYWLWCYHFGRWNKKPLYKLCSSAYAAGDHSKLFSFRGRCYKWGYFIPVENYNVEASLDVSTLKPTTIMWCARFLKLKHPELPVLLAKKLKDEGYGVQIDMYGSGEKLEDTRILCKKLQVTDVVTFKGNVPNEDVLKAMRQHDIFLFTSDKHEGWGAVLNEAMSNGCAVVASDAIGSVPYLIEDGKNGFCYRSKDVDSLFEKVKFLLEHEQVRRQMGIQAYYSIKEIWSPRIAAHNFLQLIDDLDNERDTSIKEGPCSKAKSL